MNFIKLTGRESKTSFYVRIEAICSIYSDYKGSAMVELSNGDSYLVLEKPERILEMIDNASYESNKK
jgi:hypothetical protein